MVNSCCAVNCTNRGGAKSRENKITFHTFPSRPELRRMWTVAVNRYDPTSKMLWQPGKHACLCSEHFNPEDFRYNRGYRLLREGAIPTRFNYLTTKVKKTRNKDVIDIFPESTESSDLPSNLDNKAQNEMTNYSQWLLDNLFSLRTQDIFCDTVLQVGEQQLKAHSVVLSAGSPFFHSALKRDSKAGLRCLILPGFDFDALEIAVRFIYTGKFEVGKKYAKADKRAGLLNSLRKLGLNLEHLEECEISHHSDAEDVVCSGDRMKSTEAVNVQDIPESSSDEDQFSSCGRDAEIFVPIMRKSSLSQSSLVRSSLNADETETEAVEDATHDVDLASEVCSNMNKTSVLSEVTNGWVLRSKTGLHVVEISEELLAEIELENQKDVVDQTSSKASLDSLKKSLHSSAKKVRTNERGVAAVRRRRLFTKKTSNFSGSYVDSVDDDDDDDLPIVKQKPVRQKKKNYVCPTCGKEFLRVYSYKIHLRVHTGERPFSCKSCGKTFGIMTNLNRHMRSHADDRTHLCHFCGRAFIQKSTLDDHVACRHTKEKKHMCTVCGRCFSTLGCYRAHMKRHTSNSTVKYRREYSKLSEPMNRICLEAESAVSINGASRFVCKICKKDYANKNILSLHLKRHTIVKPFVCNFCSKSFWQRLHLEIHERSHTGEAPFTCSFCGKGFSSRGQLGIHEMLHSDKKPYKCVTCGSSFRLLSYLKIHMRIHTDDRPHECKICGKKYKQNNTLQLHLNRAHGLQ